jgi:hypothetical protein
MKLFVLLSLALSVGCNAASNASKKTLPVSKAEEAVKADAAKSITAEKKEEDSDDKAKKPIEIKEESISLSGNTGCSLDEAKPGL